MGVFLIFLKAGSAEEQDRQIREERRGGMLRCSCFCSAPSDLYLLPGPGYPTLVVSHGEAMELVILCLRTKA